MRIVDVRGCSQPAVAEATNLNESCRSWANLSPLQILVSLHVIWATYASLEKKVCSLLSRGGPWSQPSHLLACSTQKNLECDEQPFSERYAYGLRSAEMLVAIATWWLRPDPKYWWCLLVPEKCNLLRIPTPIPRCVLRRHSKFGIPQLSPRYYVAIVVKVDIEVKTSPLRERAEIVLLTLDCAT